MKNSIQKSISTVFCLAIFFAATAQRRYVSIAENSIAKNFKSKTTPRVTARYTDDNDSLLHSQQYQYAVTLLAAVYPSSEKQKEGIGILQSLTEKGNVDAGMFLANAYFKGKGVDRDEEKAIKIIEKMAAKQYPQALYQIGTFYSEGGYIGYTENKASAISYYKRAAAKDYAPAYTALGLLAEANSKYIEAANWYKKAMLKKDLKSMAMLANMYKVGKGMAQPNLDEATRIYYLILTSSDYEHSKFYSVYENFFSIGNKVPDLNFTTFKALYLKLLEAAGNNYKEIIGEEKLPMNWEKNSTELVVDPTTTYFKSNLNLHLKNPVIVKSVLPAGNASNAKENAVYSYQADIVFYATPIKSRAVFTKWANFLQQLVPASMPTITNEDSNKPSFAMPVTLANGKQIKVELAIVGQRSDRVTFKILE